MKKAILNWRYWVYMALGGIGCIELFGVPADDSETWFADMLLSKAIAAAAFYAMYKLITVWDKNGKIPEISEILNNEEV